MDHYRIRLGLFLGKFGDGLQGGNTYGIEDRKPIRRNRARKIPCLENHHVT